VSGQLNVTYSAASGSTFPLGATQVTVTATDAGNTTSKTFTVTVRDTTAPVLSLPPSAVLEATGPCGAAVTYTASAADLVSGNVPVSFSIQSGSVFPLGTTSVTVTATDAADNTATGTFTVTIGDTTAPAFQSLTASPDSLGSPNHKMVPVTLAASVADVVDAAPDTRIFSVTSNEPVNGTGDGNTTSDWEVTGALTLNLRAERTGNGTGRTYTITVESVDNFGNRSLKTVTVVVPRK
jgi:hypothetical protein